MLPSAKNNELVEEGEDKNEEIKRHLILSLSFVRKESKIYTSIASQERNCLSMYRGP